MKTSRNHIAERFADAGPDLTALCQTIEDKPFISLVALLREHELFPLGKLGQPRGIAIAPNGDVWIADCLNNNVIPGRTREGPRTKSGKP